MQKPQSVALNDVLITEELSRRSSRSANLQAENQAMRSLAQQMANAPEIMLQSLTELTVELCQAGTAGVSLLETTASGEEIFRWTVLAGTLAQFVGGTTPRNFSPCGVCLDQGAPVLFSHAERYFTYFQAANTPIVEGLVLPLTADDRVFGTIWIMSHDEQRHFDPEDVRIMTSLADFTAVALLLNQRQTRELLAKNVQLEAEVSERKQAEAQGRDAQKRLELSLTGANLGVWTYNVSTDEFWADDRAKQMHGHAPHEVHTFQEAGANIHPDDYHQAQAFARAIQTRSKLQIEYRVIWQDGSLHWIASYAESIPADNPDEGMFYGVAQDITERKRAEASLRESEEKYRSLFNSINEGYALCELLHDENETLIDWRILEVNPAFESLTGLTQAAGKSGSELNQFLNTSWLQTLATVAQTGKAIRFEQFVGGVGYWFDISVSRIDGDSHHIVVVFSNITDRKQAEAERIQLIQEQAAREEERQRAESLAELDRAKTIFFSNVSHEFRTPLTLILAPLQNTLRSIDQWKSDVDEHSSIHPDIDLSALKEQLQFAYRNSLSLLKLVNTLLDFSRIEAGRMEAVYESTDLTLFTTELASVFRSAIEQAGLWLIVDCLPLAEPVYVDRAMWEKIVLNLISNAFKFTFAGEIAVRLHQADHQVILQIQDTGTGIAPDHLPHLFERFYQVRGKQARTHEGSGIGLALVAELVQLQGGTIAVSSTLGEGTCFTIALPFGSDHLPPERIQASRPSTHIETAPYIQEVELWRSSDRAIPDQTQILLVDDNADMRDYLTRILGDHVQVEAVANGEAALFAARSRTPDLILSDVMMPGLDGFQLLQALRTDSRTKDIPIVLLSARAGEEAIAEGLNAGADDYLIKPFSAQELVSRVNAHLQMAHLRGEALHQARTAIRRKDELLSVVSHELNTPLVSILGWTRLLRSNPSNSAMLSKALDAIEHSAMIQAKLVQDLLDVSRITAGKLRLNLQPTELKAVIEGAIATVTQLAAEAGIHLIWTETTTAVVMGDRERLQQIICNLLTNAIKFTPNNGRVDVYLSLVADHGALIEDEESVTNKDYAEIRVTDTGIGIAPDFLPHMFEQFRQAEEKNSAKGLGLGLAIARHIVELHNGTIQAQSAGEGQGTTFIVRLPLLEEV